MITLDGKSTKTIHPTPMLLVTTTTMAMAAKKEEPMDKSKEEKMTDNSKTAANKKPMQTKTMSTNVSPATRTSLTVDVLPKLEETSMEPGPAEMTERY